METMLSVATQHLTVQKERLAVQLAALENAKHARLFSKQENCLQLFYLTPNGNGAGYSWYKGRVARRIDGTCNWFLQHENFQKWLSQESGPLLVTADPGCGKSVLAKYLIDHELAQQSATVCYFFFKAQDQNTIRQALCALLHQLFCRKKALIQHAMEHYSNMGAKLVTCEESLWTILRDAVSDPQAGSIILVIDALDECHQSQLQSLKTSLEDIFNDQRLADAKFKVLMTSRPYEQVVRGFRSFDGVFPVIHVPGEDDLETISTEINCVINHRVKKLAQEHQLSEEIKSSLSRKLLAIEHRTYLWVYLVFDYLNGGFKFEATDDDEIDAAIRTLPMTVNQAYDQILNRSQKDKTVKVLSIILAARRPLTLSEMNVAMSVNDQGRGRSIYHLKLEPDSDFKTRLRDWCGLFVNVHHDRVYLLHQTAREFLLQSSTEKVSSGLQWKHIITARQAHSVLAEICMCYLDMLNSTDREAIRQGSNHSALSQYSVEQWGDHYREADFESGSGMVDLASALCTPDLTSHSEWASIVSSRYGIPTTSSINVLVASRLGLTPVTKVLLGSGAKTEAKDSHERTALMNAAHYGRIADARLLLDKGADIKARDCNRGTALIHAAGRGHEAVTRLLLTNGADVKAKNSMGWTALMLAAGSGYEAVTRLLLESGAEVEANDYQGWTALMLAAGSGFEATTRLLIEKGADVAVKDGQGWTAMLYAASNGRDDTTRVMLESGADIKATTNSGQTALMLAARSGSKAVTPLLLWYGADVEVKDCQGWTALLYAARSGRDDITQLLLENGADVEAADDDGRTALVHAGRHGHEAVTRLLLENGAGIEAKDNNGWAALRIASETTTRVQLERRQDGSEGRRRRFAGWLKRLSCIV